MPSPVLQAWSKATSGDIAASTLTVGMPSGLLIGDLIIGVFAIDNSTSGIILSVADTSWNKLLQRGDSIPDAYIGVWWKIAESGEPSVTFNIDNGTARRNGYVLRISGFDPNSAIDVSASNTRTSSPHTVPAVITTKDDALLIIGTSFDGGDGMPFTIDAPYTLVDQQQSQTDIGGVSSCFGQRDFPTAGDTGTATVNASVSDGSSNFQLAINAQPPPKLSDYVSPPPPAFDSGTWTPTLENTSSSYTSEGRWQKVGSYVTIMGRFTISNSNDATVDVLIGGLPFAPLIDTWFPHGGGYVNKMDNVDFGGVGNVNYPQTQHTTVKPASDGSGIEVWLTVSNTAEQFAGVAVKYTYGTFADGAYFDFTCTYAS